MATDNTLTLGEQQRSKAITQGLRSNLALVKVTPSAPRDVKLDSSGVLTWTAPRETRNVTHYNIYSPDDTTLVATVAAGTTRLTGLGVGSVFVSSYNHQSGLESFRAQSSGTIKAGAYVGAGPVSQSTITGITLLTNPSTDATKGGGTVFNYSLVDPGGWEWDIYELDWQQPTIAQDPNYVQSFYTIQWGFSSTGTGTVTGGINLQSTGGVTFSAGQVGSEIHVNNQLTSIVAFTDSTHATLSIPVSNGAGQLYEIWNTAPGSAGANQDAYGQYAGTLVTESIASSPGALVQNKGKIPANFSFPPVKNSDGSTNVYTTARIRVYAVSVLGQNPSGASVNPMVLQTGWSGGLDHWDLNPAIPGAALNLGAAASWSMGNGVGLTSQQLVTKVAGGLTFDGSGNNIANLGYTMAIKSGQIVLSNLVAILGLPSLPDANYPQGSAILNTSDHKIYRNTTGSSWVVSSDPADLVAGAIATGVTLAAAQVTAGTLAAGVVYAGQINVSQLNAGQITTCTLQVNLSGVTTTVANTTIAGVGVAGVLVQDNASHDGSVHATTFIAIYNTDPVNNKLRVSMASNGSAGIIRIADGSGTGLLGSGQRIILDGSNGNISFNGLLTMTGTGFGSATAGGVAIPASALGFFEMVLNGTTIKVPYFGV